MRRTVLACLGFSTLALAPFVMGGTQLGCSSQPMGEHVIRSAQPIQGGAVDQTDVNVVSYLINTSQGMALCSGSLIAPNLILSAHHCVADPPSNLTCGAGFSATYSASSFMVTNSYNAAANIFNSSSPSWPTADGTTWWAVKSVAVPGNDICGDDMSALLLSQPMSGVCPLVPAVDTPAADNSTYKAVGFGITSPNGQTAGTRYEVSGMTVQCFGASDCGDNTISSTAEWEGGATSSKGTCEGDSGGPALDSSNRIIGTVSRGPQSACNQTVYESTSAQATWIKAQAQAAASAGGYAAAGWVTGGATSNPANAYAPCTGAGTSSSSGTTSSSSSSTSSGSTSGGVPTNCSQADNGIGCCVGNTNYYCTNTNTVGSQDCASTGQVCGWDSSNSYYGCVSAPASSDPSGKYPLACAGTSSGNTSSSSGNSSSGNTSSSSGGTGGVGTGGSGTGLGGSHNVGNTSGCSVSSSGGAPASPASLAGLLLGAALVVSRRRR